jgi:hypothetical protein
LDAGRFFLPEFLDKRPSVSSPKGLSWRMMKKIRKSERFLLRALMRRRGIFIIAFNLTGQRYPIIFNAFVLSCVFLA